jgi:uncharacterized protein YbjT (DUF2867 family)
VGRAVVSALRARGHQVVEGARGVPVTRHSLPIDYAHSVAPAEWADRLRAHQIEAVVNCVGILMPSRGQSFERIHANGPTELFRGAALAGVRRVVQISALGVSDSAEALATPYLHSKLQADDALAATSLEWAVLRPSLVYGPHSQSAALFATLASLPVISLPGLGGQQVQPIHVFELAETVARLLEQAEAPRAVFELGGEQALSYRDMLAHYRHALGLPAALWLPVPLTLMKLGAWAAELLPQKVFCRDTIALLDRGSVPAHNHAPLLLGRAPCNLAHGLAVTAPEPMLDLRVQLSPLVQGTLRAALAFMWIYTAVITLLLPEASGVMNLLARCGLEGRAAQIAMLFSCTLNLGIGAWTLWRPAPLVFAVQLAAVIGYTATAAFNMPELTIDHCGPLVKNLPVLGLVAVLWLAVPAGSRAAPRAVSARRQLGAVSMV